MPACSWGEQPLEQFLVNRDLADPGRYLEYRRGTAPRFLFAPSDRCRYGEILRGMDRLEPSVLKDADRVVGGGVQFFGDRWVDTGTEIDWHWDYLGDRRWPSEGHWSRLNEFSEGDIKHVWEPSRFGFVFTLVRAYWRDPDPRYPECFWKRVESWRAANPPNTGVHWICGQETALRAMACCFGLYGFLDSDSTTPERVRMLAEFLAVSANRISGHLDYALSQNNNHGVSEAMGLYLVGLLFPEFKDSPRWRVQGRAALDRQARSLIYSDGSFSQHSLNYHRVMLQNYLLVLRLAEIHSDPFPGEVNGRVGRAIEWIEVMHDPVSGMAPNLGANDGALILPLSRTEFEVYRPLVAAARYWRKGSVAPSSEPWSEESLWLNGPEAISPTPAATATLSMRHGVSFPEGGYHFLSGEESWVLLRCPQRFVHRPSHADLLHVDLWWRGINMAQDAGTFSYNAAGVWNNGLVRTEVHNTVGVDGEDQMLPFSRFLFLRWARGGVRWRPGGSTSELEGWDAWHEGYCRLAGRVIHRRSVRRLPADHWLVVDTVKAECPHQFRLHWLLPDLPKSIQIQDSLDSAVRMEISVQTGQGPYYMVVGGLPGIQFDSVVGDDSTTRGWCSRRYARRDRALSVAASIEAVDACFWTVAGPSRVAVRSIEAGLRLSGEGWESVWEAGPQKRGGEGVEQIASG